MCQNLKKKIVTADKEHESLKPQMQMEESFHKTKRFFHKILTNIKSLVTRSCPKEPLLFSGINKIGSKLKTLHTFCRNFSNKWDTHGAAGKREGHHTSETQTERHEQCSQSSMSISDNCKLEDLKQGNRAGKKYREKHDKSAYLAAKMKDLEMMDANDGEHVLDMEEVLHYYSLLTSPIYLDIVDKFFMEMYSDFHLPKPTRSVSSSMRKLGSASCHSSMRKLGSASVHNSMRKLGSASCHGSMRKLGSASVHSSMRKLGTASIHSSMRKVGPESVHSSMRKVGTAIVHCSMRSLGPLKP